MATIRKIEKSPPVRTTPDGKPSKRKVAIYARVSTDRTEQQTSLDSQEDYYQKLIRSHEDWEYVGTYADNGISGTSVKHREQFQKMIGDCREGKIDLILTKSISRFARNTIDSVNTLRLLKSIGVEVFFQKENIWSLRVEGEFLITLLSSLAQEESRSISENTAWGIRQQMSKGKVSVSYKTFLGYDKGPDGKMVINEEQAKTVRLIYSYFLSGLSCYEIANRLMRAGVKSPAGKDKWWQSTVKSILTNEKYKGDALLQKEFTEDFLTHRRVKNNGELPQYYAEKDHEAIIEPDVFEHVQDEIVRRERENRNGGQTIFSMKIKCGDCGSWYGPKVWHSNDPYRKVVWQCGHKFSDKEHRCQTPHLTEQEIKAAFVKAMRKLLTEKDELKENLQTLLRDSTNTEKLEEQKQRSEAETRVYADALNEETARNSDVAQDQEDYRKREAELMDQYNAAEESMAQAEEEIRMAGIRRKDIKRFIDALDEKNREERFVESEWSDLVDFMTIYRDGRKIIKFKAGMEVEI